jgi:hypothetical protein
VSNIYENNIFPTLPCVVVEIHDITADFCMLCSFFNSFSVKMKPNKLTQHFLGKTFLHVKIVFLVFSLVLDERRGAHKTSNLPIPNFSKPYVSFDAEFYAESFGSNFQSIRPCLGWQRLKILYIISHHRNSSGFLLITVHSDTDFISG